MITFVLGAYAALAAVAYGCQRMAIFPAPGEVRRPELEGAALVEVPGASGAAAFALYLPAPEGAPTVVHFHGNGEQLADVVHLARELRAAGLGVYAVEYPGYGLARQTAASEEAIYAAAHAAIDHLHRVLGVPIERTVLSGQSLGTGVAAEMAARGLGARLLLVSPYTSMVEMMGRFVPMLPCRLICRDPFDTLAKAPRIDVPVLVVHGSDDELIPAKMGRTLSGVFPRARLVVIPGGHHNDLFSGGHPDVLPALAAFAAGRAA